MVGPADTLHHRSTFSKQNKPFKSKHKTKGQQKQKGEWVMDEKRLQGRLDIFDSSCSSHSVFSSSRRLVGF